MIFEFKITHVIEGTVTISEPDGWASAAINFERHPDFHSLVEGFKVSFKLYGSNGVDNGYRDWVLNIEKVYGPDTVLGLIIRLSEDGGENWDILYTGQLALGALIEDIDDDYTVEIPFTQIGLWTDFLNRYDTPINLKSPVDLNGSARIVYNQLNTKLTSQTLKVSYRGYNQASAYLGDILVDGNSLQLGFDTDVLDEIDKTYHYSPYLTKNPVYETFDVQYGGLYSFDIKIPLSRIAYDISGVGYSVFKGYVIASNYPNGDPGPNLQICINVNGTDVATCTRTQITVVDDLPHNKNVAYTLYTFNGNLELKKGDKVYVYGKGVNADAWDLMIIGKNSKGSKDYIAAILAAYGIPFNNPQDLFDFPNGYGDDNHFNVTAFTLFPESFADGFLIHDVANAICDRIIGADNTVYAPYLGSPFTASRQYLTAGCGWAYMLFKGLQLRLYTLAEKPFFISMKDWFEGANPILNLGLGYDKVNGQDVIKIGAKSEFYDNSDISIRLSNVRKIKRYYDSDTQFNGVKLGYTDWKSDDISGLDDTQTTKTWSTRLKMIGKKFEMLSTWIAASLLFEQARRTTRIKSSDYKFDDNNFVLAIVRSNTGAITPELDEVFTNVTNLQSEATRYNKRLTPARMLVRWLSYVSAGLQHYITSKFVFASAEGNYDMSATMNSPCAGPFNGVPLSEKQDIQVSSDAVHCSELYQIEHYLTYQDYKVLQQRRHYALEVSQSETDYNKCHIKNFSYEIVTGRLTCLVWAKQHFDLQVLDDLPQDIERPTCIIVSQPPDVFDDTFDGTFN